MGKPSRGTRNVCRPAAVAAALAVLALGACASGSDDSSTADDATAATMTPGRGDAADGDDAGASGQLLTEPPLVGGADPPPLVGGADPPPVAEGAGPSPGAAAAPAGGSEAPTVQLAGPAIAVEARATLETDDVRTAVDGVTFAVTSRGGRVSAADVDFVPAPEDGGRGESRATLVLEVPPEALTAVVAALEELGTLASFDQFAEDVTEQLADLDSRIANTRASIERVRGLLAQAVDIEDVVFLESELTTRETELETLLAGQRRLEDRVAVSTLTVEVVTAAPRVFAPVPGSVDARRPGVVEALSDGWSAFLGGVFALVLVLAVAAPFVVTAVFIAVLALWARRLIDRGRRPVLSTPPRPPAPAPDAATPEPELASRQG